MAKKPEAGKQTKSSRFFEQTIDLRRPTQPHFYIPESMRDDNGYCVNACYFNNLMIDLYVEGLEDIPKEMQKGKWGVFIYMNQYNVPVVGVDPTVVRFAVPIPPCITEAAECAMMVDSVYSSDPFDSEDGEDQQRGFFVVLDKLAIDQVKTELSFLGEEFLQYLVPYLSELYKKVELFNKRFLQDLKRKEFVLGKEEAVYISEHFTAISYENFDMVEGKLVCITKDMLGIKSLIPEG